MTPNDPPWGGDAAFEAPPVSEVRPPPSTRPTPPPPPEVLRLEMEVRDLERERDALKKQVKSLQSESNELSENLQEQKQALQERTQERDALQKQVAELQDEEKRAKKEQEDHKMELERAVSRRADAENLREDARHALLKKEQRIFVRLFFFLLLLPAFVVVFKENAWMLAASLSPLTVYLGAQGFRMGAVTGSERKAKSLLKVLKEGG